MHEATVSHAAGAANAQRPDAAESDATVQTSYASAAHASNPANAPAGNVPAPSPGYVASPAQTAADIAAQIAARPAPQPPEQQTETTPQPEGGSHVDRA